MENQTIRERLTALRERMKQAGIDYYMIPTADFHHSEYVSGYFKVRQFFSGFTGSSGTLLVERERAGLWTDGRYFIQAEEELAGTGITLFRMLNEGVPTLEEYLAQNMQTGEMLGFDGRVVDAKSGLKLKERLEKKGAAISYQVDLAEEIWQERPALPEGEIRALPVELTGKSAEEKLGLVRAQIKKKGAQALFLSRLDDIMWLFNIRGRDVDCNPVALSYAYITETQAVLFLRQAAVTPQLKEYLNAHGIEYRPYETVMSFLADLPKGLCVQAEKASISYSAYQQLAGRVKLVDAVNPTEHLKAVKNETELQHMREVYLKDSAAVCKFIYWLKSHIEKEKLTEVSAAQHLDGLRRETEGFLDLSFPTISGYAENAAKMHYEATEEQHKVLEPKGMLLVDSGGQYEGGTTDVTRTIVLGEITEEIKRQFSAVASGMLQLAAANFLQGCTGRNLDILARQPLWDMNIDYKCGTGHGIGYMLNVHEGPQNIRWRFAPGMREAALVPGMVVSNEPGVYIEGSHGIRTENIMVVVQGEKNGDGQFLYFETLTFVPIDREAIEPKYMTRENLERLNAYHRQVREKITPYLTQEEAAWLAEATEPIG